MKYSLRSAWAVVLIASLAMLQVAGCGLPPGYIPTVVAGELDYLSRMMPISLALLDPGLTQAQRDKLAFVVRARDFAHDEIGLVVGNNFQSFVNLDGETLAYNLTASRKDAFEPYYWAVPLFGPLPYLGFFDLDQALEVRDELVEQQYDTFVYQIDAFAVVILPDPISSNLLERDYGLLADVVIHELVHNTIATPSDFVFNESLAVFVARTAAMQFLEKEFGANSDVIVRTQQSYEDEDRFNTHLRGIRDSLDALYARDLSYDETLAQREEIFSNARTTFTQEVLPLMHNQEGYQVFTEIDLNNAYLLVNIRYHSDQDVFEAVFEHVNRSWPEAMRVFRTAAARPNPLAYLRDVAGMSAGN